MVGAIGPHVQGNRQLRDSIGSVTLFTLGAVAGGSVTGSLVGVLGAALQALAGQDVLAVAVGAAGCGCCWPTWESSACERRPFAGRPAPRGIASAVLGPSGRSGDSTSASGFSTIRLSSLYWLLVLFVAAFVSPVLAPLVFALYGLGLGIAFAAAVVVQLRRASPRRLVAWAGPPASS